jgi:hypothetical protein
MHWSIEYLWDLSLVIRSFDYKTSSAKIQNFHLCLIKYHAKETYEGVEVQRHHSVVDGGE